MRRKSNLTFVLLGLFIVLMLGCQSGTQETQAPGTEAPGAKKAGTAEATKEKVTVPAGTALQVRLTDQIDTGKTNAGASFEGSLAAPLEMNGAVVASLGSKVTGKVTNVVSSGRLSRPAELSLVLTSLTPEGGDKTEISTQTWSTKGESHKKRDIEMIGGGAAAGAVIGALTGGKKGAAIGSALGAGGGTGVAAATGKKEIVLAPETKLTFKLSAPVTLPAKKKA